MRDIDDPANRVWLATTGGVVAGADYVATLCKAVHAARVAGGRSVEIVLGNDDALAYQAEIAGHTHGARFEPHPAEDLLGQFMGIDVRVGPETFVRWE